MAFRSDSDPTFFASKLKRSVYSPLCGLLTSVGYSLHPQGGPKVRVNGGELTGMHVLLDRAAPKPGSYHIGGVGLNRFESEVKVYAEAVERYCAGTAILHSSLERRWASRKELLTSTRDSVLDVSTYGFSKPAPNGHFDRYSDEAPLTWVKVPRLNDSSQDWVPAQLFYLGYNPQRNEGEPWIGTAVTTGTAVHSTRLKAVSSAAYELIQVDAAMGFWHGASRPVRIDLAGPRLASLRRILDRSSGKTHKFRFYWLKTPGMQGFTIACVMESEGRELPFVAIGLGADQTLEGAIYKAFLETAGVRMLSVWTSFDSERDVETTEMLDLDSNVSYYSLSKEGADFVLNRFESGETLSAQELPDDCPLSGLDQVQDLLDGITAVSPLYAEDFTSREIISLGLHCVRLWAPGLLPLSLPSAPMENHPRYNFYGGFANSEPHPYP